MSNEVVCFSIPKIDEAEKDIQDTFCISSSRAFSLAAIADGAASSLYPRKWADIVVQAFCCQPEISIEHISKSSQDWLRPLQENWRQYYLSKVSGSRKRNWWEAGSETKDHGYATFVGLRIQHPTSAGERKWEAVAVGDSCLFKIDRKNSKLKTFPLEKSSDFKSVAKCVHSLPEYSSFSPSFIKGLYKEGDIFLLATDALAQWIFKDSSRNGDRWKQIIELTTPEDFVSFINHLRQDNLIKNDDTTLARIKIVT